MSLSLLEKLSEYCDKLVGESLATEPLKPVKRKKRKKEQNLESPDLHNTTVSVEIARHKTQHNLKENHQKKVVEVVNKYEVNHRTSLLSAEECLEPNFVTKDDDDALSKGIDQTNRNLVTDDGFKIVTSIPEDDSDISDAFESHVEGDYKTTDDGFKIISDIPPDDSDVSDAFTDDDEDSDRTGEEASLKGIKVKSKKHLHKPILQMIDDFGLDENILNHRMPGSLKGEAEVRAPKIIHAVRNSKKKRKKAKIPTNPSTLASRMKPKVDVTVYDYATKWGPSEKPFLDVGNENSSAVLSKEDLEKQIKSMRFDIYKFGMTGFNKKKKKETRAALAIKLGAVPRKKGPMKYKDLLIKKKKEKARETAEREIDREMGIEKKKPKKNTKGKRKPRAFSSQVGKFRDGVLSLSRKDLAKIKKS